MSVNSDSDVKYRRSLNSDQVKVLEWLYRVRFSASKQIAVMLKKSSHKAIQNKLQILEEQGLIGKRYDKSYKLAGRAAEYYLTPNGARKLQEYYINSNDLDSLAESVIKSLYKNKSVSDGFVLHCLLIADAVRTLKNLYDDKISIYSQAIISGYEQFPTWKPDLYLRLKTTNETRHYMLDIWDDSRPFFVSVRKVRNYLNHQEDGGWTDDDEYPAILAACRDQKAQKKLNKQIQKALDDSDNDEMIFATTTLAKLESATKMTDEVWSKISVDGDIELCPLKELHRAP